MGVKPEKLVLALPWYGYDYPCTELKDNVTCNCSDAGSSSQIGYAQIEDLVVSRATYGPQWEQISASFFFNYEDSVGLKRQVWYDNATSLKLKYEFAAKSALNGVAVWNTDLLDFSDLARSKQQTKAMWDALLN